ncbi:hypothetical protein BDN72DRAFT_857824 [Pluteus cervinus]|uniref:Uncharacterized protein n=1 Tax=Pluteus cervinus TaxID=181527 RepID=A0ACD3AV56_9AGAR|nr:hypothetical protein BDN72DRAFT_857824 [Pluteus cervinus]
MHRQEWAAASHRVERLKARPTHRKADRGGGQAVQNARFLILTHFYQSSQSVKQMKISHQVLTEKDPELPPSRSSTSHSHSRSISKIMDEHSSEFYLLPNGQPTILPREIDMVRARQQNIGIMRHAYQRGRYQRKKSNHSLENFTSITFCTTLSQ